MGKTLFIRFEYFEALSWHLSVTCVYSQNIL